VRAGSRYERGEDGYPGGGVLAGVGFLVAQGLQGSFSVVPPIFSSSADHALRYGRRGFRQRLGHRQIAEPLVVGGHDEPRGVLGGASAEGGLVGVGVGAPQLALVPVARRQFPELLRRLLAGEQALFLLVLRDVQVELHHDHAGVVQQLLEGVDVGVALLPDRLGHVPVDPDHEHVLVVRPVEERHPAPLRRDGVDPPQEIVGELALGRHLERGDVHADRVHGPGDRFERAVLADVSRPCRTTRTAFCPAP
jgi:hypothetical protein